MNVVLQVFDSIIQFASGLGVAGWVSVLTLVVVCYQVYLMVRQTRILEKQDDLLARRADFVLKCTATPSTAYPGELRLEFFAQNTGNKTAKDFYWRLFIPQALASTVSGFVGFDKHLIRDFKGVRCALLARLMRDDMRWLDHRLRIRSRLGNISRITLAARCPRNFKKIQCWRWWKGPVRIIIVVAVTCCNIVRLVEQKCY
jgi:hypothetical protein